MCLLQPSSHCFLLTGSLQSYVMHKHMSCISDSDTLATWGVMRPDSLFDEDSVDQTGAVSQNCCHQTSATPAPTSHRLPGTTPLSCTQFLPFPLRQHKLSSWSRNWNNYCSNVPWVANTLEYQNRDRQLHTLTSCLAQRPALLTSFCWTGVARSLRNLHWAWLGQS